MTVILMSDSDHPYKRLFSHPEMMADLIRGFLSPDLSQWCDLSSLTRCNGSYVTDDLREREDDIIWRVSYGDQTLLLYLLIEFQSKPDYSMPVRIMSYMSLLWQDLFRTKIISPYDKLPGIIPLVLYNGEVQWVVSQDIKDTIAIPDSLIYFRPSVPYILICFRQVISAQYRQKKVTTLPLAIVEKIYSSLLLKLEPVIFKIKAL